MNEQQLLDEHGVDKIYFYTVGTPIMTNTFTVCVLYNSQQNRIEARGVSICSLLDAFKHSKGKDKAFGRAKKALKHKDNFYKINGKSRRNEFVQREMKIKTEEDDNKFKKEIIPELVAIFPDTPIKVNHLSASKTKYIFDVPLSYPVEITNKHFKYKAQYRPTPSGPVERDLMTPPSP